MTVTPLNVLLARPLLSLTREYERHDETSLPLPMLLLALQVVGDDGVDPREAPALARVSRRATHIFLKTKWFEPRAGRVYLSPAGRAARVAGFEALAKAESEWTARVGTARVAALRRALVGLVDQFELELPHYWITYAGVDPRVTGGNFRPTKPGPPRIPARGQDWAPVLREPGSSAADLSLTALVSQALVGFAIEYEANLGALHDAVLTLAPLDGRATPLEGAPARAELTGTGKSRLERHGMVKVTKDSKGVQMARLTPIGQYLLDEHAPRTARVEAVWRDLYGETAVRRLRSALEAVAPTLGDGLADHPFLAWSLKEGVREVTGS